MLEQSGTKITDIKGGVVWDVSVSGGVGTAAYGGHTLVFNSTERSIMTTLDGTGGSAAGNPIPVTGTFATLDSAKTQVALAVGYPDPTYAAHVRNALGDTNGLISADNKGVGMAGNSFHTSWFDGSENLGQTRWEEPFMNHPIEPGLGDVADPSYFETATLANVPSVQFSVAAQSNSVQRYEARNAETWALLVDAAGETLKTNYAVATDTLDPDYDGYTWFSGLTPAACMRFAGMRMVGYALFEFDVVPSDLDSALQWTAQQWLTGRRAIHPSLL